MKRILFAGACDKSDLLLYVGKVLAAADQKVLIVDATVAQHHAETVPQIDENYRISEFQGFDVASGFFSYEQLQDYFAEEQEKLEGYDCLIIDTDCPDTVGVWEAVNVHLLATTQEKRCLQRNEVLVRQLFAAREDQSPLSWFKLILRAVDCSIDEEYIESTLQRHPIQWMEPSFAIYWDEVDYAVKIENQYNSRLQLRTLSKDYKETIQELAHLVSGLPVSDIKSAMKQAERRK
jgi:hypothetical protein